MQINDYNYYRLIRNANFALGNLTLGISTFGTSLFVNGYRTPSIAAMTITGFMATGCLYKLAYDYYKDALKEKEKEIKK